MNRNLLILGILAITTPNFLRAQSTDLEADLLAQYKAASAITDAKLRIFVTASLSMVPTIIKLDVSSRAGLWEASTLQIIVANSAGLPTDAHEAWIAFVKAQNRLVTQLRGLPRDSIDGTFRRVVDLINGTNKTEKSVEQFREALIDVNASFDKLVGVLNITGSHAAPASDNEITSRISEWIKRVSNK